MKKTRTKSIGYDTLQAAINFADSVIAENPGMTYKDFTIALEYDYGDSCHPVLEYPTEESPAEKIFREKSEALQAEWQTKWDREQFEKLKKKFEGKSK